VLVVIGPRGVDGHGLLLCTAPYQSIIAAEAGISRDGAVRLHWAMSRQEEHPSPAIPAPTADDG
ncbi:hypothetical protein, partial [Escherichia coli]|uniref:hypothetical protein n=1 Tax=Escherichia coli TaxID=562 RepID=UPI001954AE70